MGIRDKLLLVIGDCSINQWARDRELPPQTVHGWIDKDRVPRKGGMETLVKATGIPEKWWLYGEGPPPTTSKPYPLSKATVLKLKSPEPVCMFDTLDADLFIYVTIAVQKMLEKTGKQLDTDKRNDLIQLIYEYCKLKGECDDEIISKFLKLAG